MGRLSDVGWVEGGGQRDFQQDSHGAELVCFIIYAKAIGLDASFQVWIYSNRMIQGNQNPTVNGTYTAALYLGALSLR